MKRVFTVLKSTRLWEPQELFKVVIGRDSKNIVAVINVGVCILKSAIKSEQWRLAPSTEKWTGECVFDGRLVINKKIRMMRIGNHGEWLR